MSAARQEVEAEVRRRCDEGDPRGAATAAIQGYGPDLLGFVHALSRDADDAGDAFADLCVRLWKSLPRFRWESTLWTWAHVLARRAMHEQRKQRIAWTERHVRISDIPELDAVIVKVHTTTLAQLRLERKDRAQRLRERLDLDEQELLILRVDRGLEWREIAQVLGEDDEAAMARVTAGLRKRFERLRDKLKTLAAEDDAR